MIDSKEINYVLINDDIPLIKIDCARCMLDAKKTAGGFYLPNFSEKYKYLFLKRQDNGINVLFCLEETSKLSGGLCVGAKINGKQYSYLEFEEAFEKIYKEIRKKKHNSKARKSWNKSNRSTKKNE